jgi:hypothetical protein
MALNQADRIAFSAAIIKAVENIASIETAQQATDKARQLAFDLDQGNKRLVDSKSTLIAQYHVEINNISGQTRTELLESDFQDGAKRILGNFLFPNNSPSTPPSIAPNPWIAFRPYAGNKAVGKGYNDALAAPSGGELPNISSMLSRINNLETLYLAIEIATGQTCTNGTCSIPLYITSASCTLNGGTWTPGPDAIVTYTAVHNELTALIADANAYRTALLNEQANIINDPDPTRQAINTAALAALTVPLAAVNAWLAHPNFNTSHGQTTCAGFFGYNPSLLAPTKLTSSELTAFKNSLTARQTAATSRQSQISSYLGSVSQNLTTGSFTGSGLYFERWVYANLRLNVIGGSLTNYLSFDRAIQGQNDLKQSYTDSKDIYETLMVCSRLSAPSNGTTTLHVKNSSGFSPGDEVYLVSDTQPEMKMNIESISGTRIVLGKAIPAKYRPNEYARLYKDIS